MPYIPAIIIDSKVWEWVSTHLTNPQWVGRILRKLRDNKEGEQAEIQRQIESCLKARDRIEAEQMELVRLAAKKVLPEHLIAKQNQDYQEQLDRFDRDLKELQQRIEDQFTDEEIDSIERWVSRYASQLAGANFAERRQFIDFIDMIGEVFLKEVQTEQGPRLEARLRVKCRLKVQDEIPLNYMATT